MGIMDHLSAGEFERRVQARARVKDMADRVDLLDRLALLRLLEEREELALRVAELEKVTEAARGVQAVGGDDLRRILPATMRTLDDALASLGGCVMGDEMRDDWATLSSLAESAPEQSIQESEDTRAAGDRLWDGIVALREEIDRLRAVAEAARDLRAQNVYALTPERPVWRKFADALDALEAKRAEQGGGA